MSRRGLFDTLIITSRIHVNNYNVFVKVLLNSDYKFLSYPIALTYIIIKFIDFKLYQ